MFSVFSPQEIDSTSIVEAISMEMRTPLQIRQIRLEKDWKHDTSMEEPVD
jgi:hypothetical protein